MHIATTTPKMDRKGKENVIEIFKINLGSILEIAIKKRV
jgi:hypothetical protein